MASIKWAQAASGTWTTAANWAGGVVPGPDDTAIIEARDGRDKYTVTVATPVSVGAVVLNQGHATLSVDSTLTVPSLALEAGTLQLDNGTLVGTVAETGGKLALIGANDVLRNVTWQGGLNYDNGHKRTTLTISGGLTLTNAGGTGPGVAGFGYGTNVVLDGVSTLDNGAFVGAFDTIAVTDTPSLTLGGQFSITNMYLDLASGVALVNNGQLTGVGVTGGSFTNNGTITDRAEIAAASFTNNNLIEVSNAELSLNLQGLQAAGAAGVIDLSNDAVLDLVGSLTTKQLNTVFMQQHISGSSPFFTDVSGTLNNAGDTLNVGTGSQFGMLESTGGGITGGTIIDHGGAGVVGGTLSALTLSSQTDTVSLLGYTVLNDVTVTGATTLTGPTFSLSGGTLSGVGTVSSINPYAAGSLTLDGVDITGANGSGAVSIVVQNIEPTGALTITAAQSVAGYSIQLTGDTGLNVSSGAILNDADLTFADAKSHVGTVFRYGSSDDSTGVTLGASFVTTIAADADIMLYGWQQVDALLSSMGTFDIAGTLELGLDGAYTDFDNTGTIDISAGGTLYARANAQTNIGNAGTIAAVSGVIDLGTAITNTGLISDTFGGSATTATIGGAITGAGTIAITGAGTLALGSTVAAGQIVQFGAGTETLDLTKVAASKGFSGTLDGFAKGDAVVLSGENITSASFSGASIIATISTGGSIVLATGTHLHGSISVSENSGNATLTYSSGIPSLQDWSAGGVTENESHAAMAPYEVSGALPRWGAPALDMILLHHPWH